MYTKIHTQKDVLRERYLYQSELTPLGFPKLLPVHASLSGLNAVSFCEAVKEKNPKKALCHFFIDDTRFEPLWNQPQKYLPMLENFKYVCAPDFSFYDSMPKVMQLHQVYRSRALAWWLFMNGCDVIPTVGWGNAETFDFCFEGLPEESTLAVSTNGCFTDQGKECYQQGFKEMCSRLHPAEILVVGRPIDVDTDVKITYRESFGQQLTRKLRG